MADRTFRVLIVEDDYFIANDISRGFEGAGIEIVGPVPSRSEALAYAKEGKIDGAVLDVNLNGEKVFDVADTLIDQAIPVVFVTGYERDSMPQQYADIPICLKPVEASKILKVLTNVRATSRFDQIDKPNSS